jgi:hypothetical protein
MASHSRNMHNGCECDIEKIARKRVAEAMEAVTRATKIQRFHDHVIGNDGVSSSSSDTSRQTETRIDLALQHCTAKDLKTLDHCITRSVLENQWTGMYPP